MIQPSSALGHQALVARPVISRRVLISSLGVIALLAAAPFIVATAVSDRRIDEAQAQAEALAEALRDSPTAIEADVLIGSGNLPGVGPQFQWLAGASLPLTNALRSGEATELSPDPWRNAYFVNVGATGPIWVISAGPNGILETPFGDATAPGGDDVGARVR